MKGVIVIPSFDRVNKTFALTKALNSLEFSEEWDLIISVDFQSRDLNEKFSREFQSVRWKHGRKKLILRDLNLGLKRHILECGNYIEGRDVLVMLEDDITVTSNFEKFIVESIRFYAGDESIGGYSLYSYRISETQRLLFEPYLGDSDIYFLQWPCSWGQFWTRIQWEEFKKYLAQTERFLLPKSVASWNNSWKKYFLSYLIASNKYVIYPRYSFTTAIQEEGQHYRRKNIDYLTNNYTENLPVIRFEKRTEVNTYSYNFQLEKIKVKIDGKILTAEVDLYSEKLYISEEYFITCDNYGRPIAEFEINTIPFENSLLMPIKSLCIGEGLKLYDREKFGGHHKSKRHFHSLNARGIKLSILDRIFKFWLYD